MKNCTVFFEVETWFDGEIRIECGLIPADSYAEAVKEIEEYFGDDLDGINRLDMVGGGLMLMQKDVARQVLTYNT